jgi:hypothetical protein
VNAREKESLAVGRPLKMLLEIAVARQPNHLGGFNRQDAKSANKEKRKEKNGDKKEWSEYRLRLSGTSSHVHFTPFHFSLFFLGALGV